VPLVFVTLELVEEFELGIVVIVAFVTGVLFTLTGFGFGFRGPVEEKYSV
jgi:hypothetical protein